MPPRRRIDPSAGHAAVGQWLAARAGHDEGEQAGAVDRQVLATAVRFTLEELGARAPGRSVEVRVPPLGVVQCVEGSTHRRGTPPAVVEMDAGTWLALATGRLEWADAVGSGAVQASGQRAELDAYLPLV
ncbi:sterol carrier family protein [Kytococcus sedentarius]|uniref:sterol carrier family protein n=1 Tax=Kytococcus sedentarius TaxID=1276 RepID=UPI0035BC02E6